MVESIVLSRMNKVGMVEKEEERRIRIRTRGGELLKE